MPDPTATLVSSNGLLTRDHRSRYIPTLREHRTHKPIQHREVIQALAETLNLRKLGVTKAPSTRSAATACAATGSWTLPPGSREGDFTPGGRNSHNRTHAPRHHGRVSASWSARTSRSTGTTRQSVRKRTRNFNLNDAFSVGVDNIQRNFEPMSKTMERWHDARIHGRHRETLHLRSIRRRSHRNSRSTSRGQHRRSLLHATA